MSPITDLRARWLIAAKTTRHAHDRVRVTKEPRWLWRGQWAWDAWPDRLLSVALGAPFVALSLFGGLRRWWVSCVRAWGGGGPQ